MIIDAELSADIDRCVRSAIAGEATLEVLVARLVGRDARPGRDDCWPAELRAVWNEAVARWLKARSPRTGRLRPEHDRIHTMTPPTADEVWAVIDLCREPGAHWWNVPGLSWPVIGSALQLGARSTQHYVGLLGWRFNGSPRHRVVTAAPCRDCHTPYSRSELNADGLCTACR